MFKALWRAFVGGVINNDEKLTSVRKRPKWLKSIPHFRPKRLKSQRIWGCTYLYSPCKGVSPPESPLTWLLVISLSYLWFERWNDTYFDLYFKSLCLFLATDVFWFSIDPFVTVIAVAFFQEVYGRLGHKPDKVLIESFEHFVLESCESLKASRMLKVTITRCYWPS